LVRALPALRAFVASDAPNAIGPQARDQDFVITSDA
jgi:hypothetical protein